MMSRDKAKPIRRRAALDIITKLFHNPCQGLRKFYKEYPVWSDQDADMMDLINLVIVK